MLVNTLQTQEPKKLIIRPFSHYLISPQNIALTKLKLIMSSRRYNFLSALTPPAYTWKSVTSCWIECVTSWRAKSSRYLASTENYKSAQVIARNFFKDYSYSEYCDDAYAILVKNNFEYARHSVENKKVERYSECVEAYQNMRINCPTSDLLKEAGKYAEEAQNFIDKKEFKKSKKKEKKHED